MGAAFQCLGFEIFQDQGLGFVLRKNVIAQGRYPYSLNAFNQEADSLEELRKGFDR